MKNEIFCWPDRQVNSKDFANSNLFFSNRIYVMKITSKMQIQYSLIGLIVVPFFGRLALTGTGHAGDLYRYLVPALVGCIAGFLIGRERGRYIDKQKELKENQGFLQSIIDNIPAPIYLKKTDGKYLFINKQYEALADITREKITSKTDHDIFPGHVAALFRSQDNQVKDGNTPLEFEETIPLKDGVHTFITKKFPLTDKNGAVYAVGGFCTDITRRRQTERELAAARDFSAAILSSLPGIFYVYDEQRRLIRWNRNQELLSGYTVDELAGMRVEDWFDESDREILLKNFNLVLEQGDKRHGCLPLVFKDGRKIPYNLSACRLQLDGKSFVLGVGIDISETIRSQEALEKREAKLRTILQTAPTGIGVVIDRVFQEVNQRFCDMVGYSEDELLGKNSRMVYPSDEEHERVGRKEMELIRKHGLGSIEACLRHKNGQEINILVSWAPLNEDGLSASIVFNALDITEIKKLEGQLSQSRKMESIGRLAGGIAHDFNNILTAVNGYAQMLLMRLEDGSELKQDVEKILKSGNRAANLTRQLLGFSRKQMIMPKRININTLITDMEEMLRRIVSEDIALETSLAEHVDAIYADPTQLEQVLMNLVVNAQDAVHNQAETKEKTIKISTSQVFLDQDYATVHPDATPGWYMELQVEDNGCGMTEEVQKHIFEPFYTTKEVGKGTGMGLATVYGIIKQNQGSIVANGKPGRGTTVKVYWPIMTREDTAGTEDEKTELSSGGSEVILLAEDDQQIREITSRQLRKAGYTVIEAENGMDALEKARKHPGGINLLFTDAVMPVMGGQELSSKIKDMHPKIPVLFASGYTDNGIHQDIIQDGNSFINKPYNIQQIMVRIRRLLDDQEPS